MLDERDRKGWGGEAEARACAVPAERELARGSAGAALREMRFELWCDADG